MYLHQIKFSRSSTTASSCRVTGSVGRAPSSTPLLLACPQAATAQSGAGVPMIWEAFLALCGREKPDQIIGTPAADWAVAAWGKAKSKGVLDGTRPTDPATRQELAVVLDRLNLI